LQLDPRQLGHAVDKPADFRTEQLLDVIERGNRVLDVSCNKPVTIDALSSFIWRECRRPRSMRKIRVAGGAQLRAIAPS